MTRAQSSGQGRGDTLRTPITFGLARAERHRVGAAPPVDPIGTRWKSEPYRRRREQHRARYAGCERSAPRHVRERPQLNGVVVFVDVAVSGGVPFVSRLQGLRPESDGDAG